MSGPVLPIETSGVVEFRLEDGESIKPLPLYRVENNDSNMLKKNK